MRNFKLIFLVHFLIIITFGIPTYGADVAKIAILDTQKALNESLLGKKMKNELEKIGAKYSADLEAKEEEIKALQDEVKKLSSSVRIPSGAERDEFDKKTRDLDIKTYDLNRLSKKYQDELAEEERKKYMQITKLIQEIVDEIGEKEGYLFIKNRRGSYYFSEHIDITDDVIRLLDSRFKKDEGKNKKEKP